MSLDENNGIMIFKYIVAKNCYNSIPNIYKTHISNKLFSIFNMKIAPISTWTEKCNFVIWLKIFSQKLCNMYGVYLFNILFSKFLLTQILEILVVNKLL